MENLNFIFKFFLNLINHSLNHDYQLRIHIINDVLNGNIEIGANQEFIVQLLTISD